MGYPQAKGRKPLLKPAARSLPSSLAQVLDAAGVQDKFIRNWLDLLSFLLSGLPADGTIAGGLPTQSFAVTLRAWQQCLQGCGLRPAPMIAPPASVPCKLLPFASLTVS